MPIDRVRNATRRTRRRPAALALTMLPALALALTVVEFASCVSPPTLDEWSEVGFRTPQETLRSFQLAVRADAPRVEYRCLSVHLRRGLPQIAWREAREEWYAENPFLRRGIAKATIVSSQELGEHRHRFVVESYGQSYVIELVREDFYQVYVNGELAADELLPYDLRDPNRDEFSDFVSPSEPEHGKRFVSGGVFAPADLSSPISELRIAWEWKVDALAPADEAELSTELHEPTP